MDDDGKSEPKLGLDIILGAELFMAEHPWTETRLWQQISQHNSSLLTASLQSWMSDIETVVAHAGTAPTDFTLHDAGHAFRVAERMVDLIPSDVLTQLSHHELVLLLLSAYLHDIGMSPLQKKVKLLHDYLLLSDVEGLPTKEQEQFVSWADEYADGLTIPLDGRLPLRHRLQLANEAVTHYVRSRHNDWSEEWIRSYHARHPFSAYEGWVDDLVLLCRSHHFEYPQLISSSLDPRPVGSPAQIVNLRYLAIVLRVADVLEFDPERTPDVILQQRDIAAGSLLYWRKDKSISAIRDGNSLLISATPTSAVLHRAIESTADAVDAELQLAQRIGHELHFDRCPGLATRLPHRWDLAPSAQRKIAPRSGTYEYIDGSFRPNTHRLLALLSGTELYGNAMAAVRELLQNAFDAVVEEIARIRLNDLKSSQEVLARTHRIELRVESSTEGVWLVCTDNGSGMTKQVIRDHLLVSGAATRRDLRQLERRCEEHSIELNRTGKFGIGVLSYFMLAERVVIRTRRSSNAPDAGETGWIFQTDGIGSFGELRADPNMASGTQVRLLLRAEVVGADAATWYKNLQTFLLDTLEVLPSRLEISSDVPGCTAITFEPGWVDKTSRWTGLIAAQVRRESESREASPELLPTAEKERRRAWDEHWQHVMQAIRSTLKWHLVSGTLPNGLGRFQVAVPFFDLKHGVSLAFLSASEEAKDSIPLSGVGSGLSYLPNGRWMFSWRGMAVRQPTPHEWLVHSPFRNWSPPAFVRVDWMSAQAGRIAVNRLSVDISQQAADLEPSIFDRARAVVRDFVLQHQKSRFFSLNAKLAGVASGRALRSWAFQWNNDPIPVWATPRYPFLASQSFAYVSLPKQLEIEGKPLSVALALRGPDHTYNHQGISFLSQFDPPDRMVAIGHSMGPTWTSSRTRKRRYAQFGAVLEFPPSWSQIAGARLPAFGESGTFWNAAHPLSKQLKEDDWQSAPESSTDPLPLKDEILKKKTLAAAWLAKVVLTSDKNLWTSIRERDPLFIPQLWKALFGHSKALGASKLSLAVFRPHHYNATAELVLITPDEWRAATHAERRAIMPAPGRAWEVVDLEQKAISERMLEVRSRAGKTRSKGTEK